MGLQEVEEWGMKWIGLARNMDGWRTIVNAVMSFRFPQNVENFFNK
jgi:hypothetical protein